MARRPTACSIQSLPSLPCKIYLTNEWYHNTHLRKPTKRPTRHNKSSKKKGQRFVDPASLHSTVLNTHTLSKTDRPIHQTRGPTLGAFKPSRKRQRARDPASRHYRPFRFHNKSYTKQNKTSHTPVAKPAHCELAGLDVYLVLLVTS